MRIQSNRVAPGPLLACTRSSLPAGVDEDGVYDLTPVLMPDKAY